MQYTTFRHAKLVEFALKFKIIIKLGNITGSSFFIYLLFGVNFIFIICSPTFYIQSMPHEIGSTYARRKHLRPLGSFMIEKCCYIYERHVQKCMLFDERYDIYSSV